MPRKARIVVPGVAHHVVQRGHNRQVVFVTAEDFQFYIENLMELKGKPNGLLMRSTTSWAYESRDKAEAVHQKAKNKSVPFPLAFLRRAVAPCPFCRTIRLLDRLDDSED